LKSCRTPCGRRKPCRQGSHYGQDGFPGIARFDAAYFVDAEGVTHNATTLLPKMLDALLANRISPVLARVQKSHEGPGDTKYSVDVRVIKAGTLEDTNSVIEKVARVSREGTDN
jgi:hypothetical protein